MSEVMFSKEDIKEIESRGLTLERVMSQIETFKSGIRPIRLVRPARVGDGIMILEESELERLNKSYSESALARECRKFVPASGAATRMFKLLIYFNSLTKQINEETVLAEAKRGNSDYRTFLDFVEGIQKFAFYDDLKLVMKKDGLDIESFISKGQYKEVLDYLLTSRGLNYRAVPKGLIKFHRYPNYSRTPFEEHLVEAANYTKDRNNVARIHFTVSPEHDKAIRDYIEKVRSLYESEKLRLEITFSTQKTSTDTIAVDLDNMPFRTNDNKLLFRAAGHGALLENLNDLNGDVVFIKNIDNVVPDKLKDETYFYKRALGGYLIELQNEIFKHLETLSKNKVDDSEIVNIFEFVRNKLSVYVPDYLGNGSKQERISFLDSKLNRPVRVCGVVKNQGEPGGGPFWVQEDNGELSLQIVESSQVDMESPKQMAIWGSSTHFSPVDIVCGVRDFLGRNFDLKNFTDPNTGFISLKSKDGRELKALELPGLWNGSMANWNTAFIEVPLITFNPVKTVFDLLRKEHRNS